MNTDQQLMNALRQTMSAARRHPRGGQQPRGAGHILALLSTTTGMSQQQLADALEIRPQSVSEAAALLEERGYILRESSPADRRITLLRLTDAGRAHAEALALERAEHARQFFAPLTEEEKATLLSLLTRLTHTKERD